MAAELVQFKSRAKTEGVPLLAQGFTPGDVAKRIGVTDSAVRQWQRDARVQAEIARFRAEIREGVTHRIAYEAQRALDVVVDIITDKDGCSKDVGAPLRGRMALAVLDRAGFGAPTGPVINIDARSADIRPEMLRALLGLQPDELRRLRSSEVVDVEASEHDHPDDERPEK